MTCGEFQEKLFPESYNSVKEKLANLYKDELEKLRFSIGKSCERGSSAGITQTIGRRFGYFWEEMVKCVFESRYVDYNRNGLEIDISEIVLETIEDIIIKKAFENSLAKTIIYEIKDSLKEILETGVVRIADFTYKNKDGKKCALEIKWRIRWNDAKTVKSHVIAAHRLRSRGYEPIMLIRRPKEESFSSPIERFEREGWKVLTGMETMAFIAKETEFDLEKWINANVDFWRALSSYHECLRTFTLTKEDFAF